MLIVPNTVIQLKAESKKPKAQSVDKRLLLRRHNFQDFHSALQLVKRGPEIDKKRLRKSTLVLSPFSPSVDTWDQHTTQGKLFFVSFP